MEFVKSRQTKDTIGLPHIMIVPKNIKSGTTGIIDALLRYLYIDVFIRMTAVKHIVAALMFGLLGLSLSACFYEERGGGWGHRDHFRGGYEDGYRGGYDRGYDHHYWR